MNDNLITKTQTASQQWKDFFNAGDAKGCASMYEESAYMLAKPLGEFTGRHQIQAFWQNLIDQGFSDVAYIEPTTEVLDSTSVLLTSRWKMNKAHGIITNELWVLQADGQMRLKEDHFEVQ